MANTGIIKNQAAKNAAVKAQVANGEIAPAAAKTTAGILNAIMDGEGYRKRFNELMGERAPQFISSIISMVNADSMLSAVVKDAPQTIITAALKAATLNLPIDPALGMAYVMPFKNNKKIGNEWVTKNEATCVLGYRGLLNLANRTGAYTNINATDVREGEIIEGSRDRMRGTMDFNWIDDDAEREKKPIIGYLAYFRLINGMEKMVYMSKAQIDAHEQRNRKGKEMTKGWRENYDAMALKTVLRLLLGKWGMMSIDYQSAPKLNQNASEALANAIAAEDAEEANFFTAEGTVDMETGEITPNAAAPSEEKVG